jgi:hypothetical protein
MPEGHSKSTIASMAVLASATATLLHEGIGHGVFAWVRGDIPTELTSNHLTSLRPDRLVEAGGTLVNLIAGAIFLRLSQTSGSRANPRYFFWLLGALNLLPGAGYFMYSGISGFGDWQQVIRGLPHEGLVRVLMTILGAVLYVLFVRLLSRAIRPFCQHRGTYNMVGRLPYFVACLFSCAAGALDPLGLKLFFLSTVAAAFGGSSGMLWADVFLPRGQTDGTLLVRRAPVWWITATVVGVAYIVVIGRGIEFAH